MLYLLSLSLFLTIVGPMCVEASPFDSIYTKQNSDMSLTFCVQICKGQSVYMAMIQNETCFCVDTMPASSVTLDVDNCTIPCPGNDFQLCGGHGDVYSVNNGKY